MMAFAWLVHAWMIYGHRNKMGSSPGDQPTVGLLSRAPLIWGGIWILGWQLLLTFGRLDWLRFPDDFLTDVLGWCLFVIGLGLRLWSMRTLGKFFTYQIGIRQAHEVIQSGPYRWVRHPSYTGYLVFLIGISLILHSLFFDLAVTAGVGAHYYFRIRDEERMLQEHFGAKYGDYMKKTWLLVPWIY